MGGLANPYNNLNPLFCKSAVSLHKELEVTTGVNLNNLLMCLRHSKKKKKRILEKFRALKSVYSRSASRVFVVVVVVVFIFVRFGLRDAVRSRRGTLFQR